MGLFDRFKKKADKSQQKIQDRNAKAKPAAAQISDNKKDLTLSELKDRQAKATGSKNKTKSGNAPKKAIKKDDTKAAFKILLRPMVTEKGTFLASENKYIFEVAPETNKIEIKKAINAVYGVWPTDVNIINIAGKKVRYGRTRGKTKDRKKAIITLKQGETIDVYEGV